MSARKKTIVAPAKKAKKAPRIKKSSPAAPTITLSREAYGTNARASAIADFAELVVLQGNDTINADDLRDRLKDSDIALPREKYSAPGDDESDSDDQDGDDSDADGLGLKDERFADSARRVFALLAERQRILKTRYPFELLSERLTLRPSDAVYDPYLALLAMTVAHAHAVTTSHDPKRIFEVTVARVLSSRGWRAANVARLSKAQRGAKGFVDTLKQVCEAVGLEHDVSNVILSHSANDAGVDTVAHNSWDDQRPGKWTLIGQATLAISDNWPVKLAEPKSPLWATMFKEHVQPLPFLAVPHHVEPLHLRKLVQDSGKVVLDRLRLALFDSTISQEERDILASVRGCAVEYR